MFPFVMCILFACLSLCNGQQTKTCNVFPKSPYVKYGSDAEVWCQTSCLPGGVFWTLNSNPLQEGLSKAINASHVVLALRNFTHQEATIQCHNAQTHYVLGGTYVRTYGKPGKISCRLEHENQDDGGVPTVFECVWEHRVASSLGINYTLIYAAMSRPDERSVICRSRVKKCRCLFSFSIRVNGSVVVKATTDHWEVESDPFVFDPHHIMKMSRPGVDVTAFPDHLLVKWSRSVSYRRGPCQVRYVQAVADGTLEVKVINKTLGPREEGIETLDEVESCTNYNVSVRCAIEKAPWSNWSQEMAVLTKLNKKHVKLSLWRKISEPTESERRKVHLMWTVFPSTCPGSFTCTIQMWSPYDDNTTRVNSTDVLCASSTWDMDVDQDTNRISLQVLENQSLLAERSVYVPSRGESLPQVTDIQTTSGEGVVLVSWKAPGLQPVRGYLVDWTHDGSQYYWKESECPNTTLSALLDKKTYNITVTPLYDSKTGHSSRVLQVCSRLGGPGNVTVLSVEANDRTAFVGWKTMSQEECSGAVVSYVVFYSTEKGPVLNVTVDGTRQNINLKELDPDTQYSVYIMATALTGSATSSRRLFRTKRFDPRLPLALGVCGSIVIVLVFSVGLFCAIQWKKLIEKPVPNPGLSSLELWSSAGHHKRGIFFQPFNNPSESLFDHIYTEEPQKTPTSPLATSCNKNMANDKTEEYADRAEAIAADAQNQNPCEQLVGCPEESTALLSLENRPFSPYRSQSSVEASASMTVSQCKRVPVEKSAPVTIYVTLDVYDEGQHR